MWGSRGHLPALFNSRVSHDFLVRTQKKQASETSKSLITNMIVVSYATESNQGILPMFHRLGSDRFDPCRHGQLPFTDHQA